MTVGCRGIFQTVVSAPGSDHLGTFGRHQHCQYSGGIANAPRDGDERFRHRRMSLRQSLKTLADAVELFDFVQDRVKRHGYTALPNKPKVWEDFRWTGLGQKT